MDRYPYILPTPQWNRIPFRDKNAGISIVTEWPHVSGCFCLFVEKKCFVEEAGIRLDKMQSFISHSEIF